MSLTYEIRDDAIWFCTKHDVDYAAGLGVLESAIEEAHRLDPTRRWDLIFDIRQSSEDRSAEELRGIADFLAEHSRTLSGRCAIVASDDLHYGLGRMFSAFSEQREIEVRVTRDVGAATAWLGRPGAG